jgi:cytoskeletal protein RodZ
MMMVPEINLLPKMERQKSNSILIIAIGFILFITVILLFFVQYFSIKGDIETLTAEETYSVAEREDLKQLVNDINMSGQGNIQTSVSFAESVSKPVSPLLIEVNALLEEHTYLREYEFTNQSINISIDVETMMSLSKLVDKLLVSKYFSDVKVESVTSFELSNSTESIEERFEIIPRYSAIINLVVNQSYLENGGVTP